MYKYTFIKSRYRRVCDLMNNYLNLEENTYTCFQLMPRVILTKC